MTQQPRRGKVTRLHMQNAISLSMIHAAHSLKGVIFISACDCENCETVRNELACYFIYSVL